MIRLSRLLAAFNCIAAVDTPQLIMRVCHGPLAVTDPGGTTNSADRLASAEIEFEKPVNINKRFHDLFEHQTVQAIISIRRSSRYRSILAKVVEDRQRAEAESDRQNEAYATL